MSPSGVRLWNVGGGSFANKIRIAYDVAGDFPASLILPQVGESVIRDRVREPR